MRIVVLDGYALNPGDLSWDGLHALGACQIYPRTAANEVVDRARDAEVVLTNKVPIDRQAIQSLPQLRYIGVLATGFNVVDVHSAREKNVIVTNVPMYGTRSVAQHTMALLLELTQRVGHHAETVRAGRWSTNLDWCYWDHPLIELEGLTMGIVGFGRIGQAVANLATAFGMQVLTNSRSQPSTTMRGVRWSELDELIATSDVVSLHCPLTPETKEIVNAKRLARMKSSAFLINTSRGPLVNEVDLAEALNRGQIAGAGLDVLGVEPPAADNPLVTARNCIITPHIAWAMFAARKRLLGIAIENLRAFISGSPTNVVN